MKLLPCLLTGFTFAVSFSQASTVPEGIATSDWAAIRAAHEASLHAPQRQGNGRLVARNPGQQWQAEFDGKGFTVNPDGGGWTWGLDLTGYGDCTLSAGTSSSSSLHHEGGKITCQRDGNLTEWFVNDRRGLEQGWDLKQRPERADPAAPLKLHLSTRGSVRPQVSSSGDSVSFQQENGVSALSYGGLKAWDADGKPLTVRFEQGEGRGLRIAVEDQAARYPVTIDPIAQQAYLKASNTGQGDAFGRSVAVFGDTVVVGAPYEASAATGVNGNQNSEAVTRAGAAYVFVRSGGTWTQQAYLKASNTGAGDQFGHAVAISGDTLFVAASYESSSATGVNGDQSNNSIPGAGAVYVFVRSGTTWTQQAYLKSNRPGAYHLFGECMAASGETLVVGASYENSSATGVNGDPAVGATDSAGAAYVFTRSENTWSQQAYLKASNTGVKDNFGQSVTIDGDTLVVGASGESSAATGIDGNQASDSAANAGAAYVFTRSGNSWSQQAYLKASNANADDFFGTSVGISGETVVVGAMWEASNARGVNGDQTINTSSNVGAAYAFTRTGTTWTQQAYFKPIGAGSPGRFGHALGFSGDHLAVGSDQGVSVFSRTGATWTAQGYLSGGNTYDQDSFGWSVALSGNVLIVGAPNESSNAQGVNGNPLDNSYTFAGAAYTFDFQPDSELPEISISLAGTEIPSNRFQIFGPLPIGSSTEKVYTISNAGPGALYLTGNPKVWVPDGSGFTVTSQPAASVIAPGGSTTFTVRFVPISTQSLYGGIYISNNDADESMLGVSLIGTGLSYTADTDGDGLSDAAEFNMAALNFDWEVKQTALVATYFANANSAGLYKASQVQALHPGKPLIAKNPATGRFKLTMDWKKSTNLTSFTDFPAPAGSSVSVNPAGDIEFEFSAADDAAFFRLD